MTHMSRKQDQRAEPHHPDQLLLDNINNNYTLKNLKNTGKVLSLKT